jgi:hypothetical protein
MTATLAGHVDFATFEAITPDQAVASIPVDPRRGP